MTDEDWTPDVEDASPNPAKMAFVDRKADADRLRAFVAACFERVDVPEADARVCADVLVDADLRGSETHGVPLLYTHYVIGIQKGEINPRPSIRIERAKPTTLSVDGDGGLGMLVGVRAMSACLEAAEEYGSGWATCYHTTHSASGGYYVRMATRRRMIGLHWSTGGCTIAPPGGAARFLGNNPFSFGAPVPGSGPFVLDMAPSTTIRPKIRMEGWSGRALPDGWVVDEAGRPITDPVEYFDKQGAILPLGSTPANGSHKGFGLLLVGDVMTGALSGDGGSLVRAKGVHASTFGAVAVDGFPTGPDYDSAMVSMIDALHEAPVLDGSPGVRFPGERSNAVLEERASSGIPLRRFVVDDLEEMAAALGVPIDDVWL